MATEQKNNVNPINERNEVENLEQKKDATSQDNDFIGTYLKNKRVESGISLEEISRKTKINITMLEHLESNSFNKLPNKAYVSGYVKSYSKEIGLNQAKAIEILDLSYADKKPMHKNHLENAKDNLIKAPEAESSPKTTFYATVLVIFCIVAGGVYFFKYKGSNIFSTSRDKLVKTETLSASTPLKVDSVISKDIEKKPSNDIKTTEIISTSTAIAPKKDKVVSSNKKENKLIEIKKEKVINSSKIIKKEESIAKSKKSEKRVELKSLPSKLYSFESDNNFQEYIPMNFQAAVQPQKQNLFITASNGDTWLTYKKDSSKIRKILLKKGKNLFIQGDEIRIFFGNINATKLFLNNQALKITSKSGVKSLVFPQNSSNKYKLPLFVFLKTGKVITSDNYETEKI